MDYIVFTEVKHCEKAKSIQQPVARRKASNFVKAGPCGQHVPAAVHFANHREAHRQRAACGRRRPQFQGHGACRPVRARNRRPQEPAHGRRHRQPLQDQGRQGTQVQGEGCRIADRRGGREGELPDPPADRRHDTWEIQHRRLGDGGQQTAKKRGSGS